MPRRCAHFVPVCLVCAATLGGHFFIARKLDARRNGQVDVAQTPWQQFPEIEYLPPIEGEHAPIGFCMDPPSPEEVMMGLPDEAPDPRAIPRLLATLGYESLAAESDGPADALRPVAGDEPPARPLSRRQREDQAEVREVIDEEMSEASSEERDIWFEELKSLPAEVVRDLLEVRRQMRVLSPDHPLSRPSPLVTGDAVQPREIVAEPVTQSRPVTTSDWSDSREALQAAIDWATHNIANADTVGYKRIEPLLIDMHGADHTVEFAPERIVFNGGGCRLATSRIDPRQGELIETGRALDLAIDGAGFFCVSVPESTQVHCTRRGDFIIDESQSLCLVAGDTSYSLFALPENTEAVEIGVDGTVSAQQHGQDGAQVIGRIQLRTFIDPARLLPVGSGILMVPSSMASQTVTPGEAGAGVIRQGFLEASNVDLEREQMMREKWETMLKLLPVQETPRTANGANRTPQ